MIKKHKTLDISLFDGDDGIQYIRYSDFEKCLARIKEVQDETYNAILKILDKRLVLGAKEIEEIRSLLMREKDENK